MQKRSFFYQLLQLWAAKSRNKSKMNTSGLTSAWDPYFSDAQSMSTASYLDEHETWNGAVYSKWDDFPFKTLRKTIKQVSRLAQIQTDIGDCYNNKLDCQLPIWSVNNKLEYKTLARLFYSSDTYVTDNWLEFPLSPDRKLREMIQARQAPLILGTRRPVPQRIDERERRARDTLRRLVGEAQYRRFLAHGFITARGKSGKIYQIRPGYGMTAVYSSTGKPIEKLCVVLRGNFPPTDQLITRFLMILNDEEHFRSLANMSTHFAVRTVPKQSDWRPLPEIFAALKQQAA